MRESGKPFTHVSAFETVRFGHPIFFDLTPARMSDDKKPVDQSDDPELNNLLDNALEDFNNLPQASSSTQTEKKQSTSDAASSQDQTNGGPEEEIWANLLMQSAVREFKNNMESLIQNDEDRHMVETSMQEIEQIVAKVVNKGDTETDPENVNPDFQSAIAQALTDLSAAAENMQTDGDLSSMFSNMSMEDEAKEIAPVVQDLMQYLLSKEVLYPSLKEAVEKYPSWLEEKKASLTSSDIQRYKKQLELMQKVCAELEKEKENDSRDVKKQRFDLIISLMQEVQTCGQPPDGLVGDMSMFQCIMNFE